MPRLQREIAEEGARKKRLGQYFTGERLACALAALANASDAKSIIDPMAGVGDMLAACIAQGHDTQTLSAIEIDPLAHSEAIRRFGELRSCPQYLLGSCFDQRTLKSLTSPTYDLVITNPPYVRYQSLSKADTSDLQLPSAVEIRSNLLDLVQRFDHLDQEDKRHFRTLISSYSGLSDLAVPSWILCALLTRVGGTLAMVVPEAWLTRDYAQLIQYMLLRWFRIRTVVEDAQAVWFPEALVKTTLLVAERIDRKASAFEWSDEGFMHVQIEGPAMHGESIVGNLFPHHESPDRALAELIAGLGASKQSYSRSYLNAEWVPLQQTADNLQRVTRSQSWVRLLDESQPANISEKPGSTANLPQALKRWLGDSPVEFSSLEQLSIGVSQGLRTGANQFFYVDLLKQGDQFSSVKPASVFGIPQLTVPSECLRPVLRRQSELPDGFRISRSKLVGRVLALQDFVLPDDLNSSQAKRNSLNTVPRELARFIKLVASTNTGTESEPRLIPALSAVCTNVRNADASNSTPPRFWYMLPAFTARHQPDVFLARVNSGIPRTVLNASNPVLIDANFSTAWITEASVLDAFALLALLNSTWAVTAMELTASVLGGGALKLEATHLRRLPIPHLSRADFDQLSRLGRDLACSKDSLATIRLIDTLMLKVLVGSKQLAAKYSELIALRDAQVRKRTTKV